MNIIEAMKKVQKDCNRMCSLIQDSKHEETLLLYNELKNYVIKKKLFGEEYKGDYHYDFVKFVQTNNSRISKVNSCVLTLIGYSLTDDWNEEIEIAEKLWNKLLSLMHPKFNYIEILENFIILKYKVICLIKKLKKTDELGLEDAILGSIYLIERFNNSLGGLDDDQLKKIFEKIIIAFNAARLNSLKNPDVFSNISTLSHIWLGLLQNKMKDTGNSIDNILDNIDFLEILERKKASFNSKNSKGINLSSILLDVPSRIIDLNISPGEKNEELFDYFCLINKFKSFIENDLLRINFIINKSNRKDDKEIKDIALSLDGHYSMNDLKKLMNVLENYEINSNHFNNSFLSFVNNFKHMLNDFYKKTIQKLFKYINVLFIIIFCKSKNKTNINHFNDEKLKKMNNVNKKNSDSKKYQYERLFSTIPSFSCKKLFRIKFFKKDVGLSKGK